MAIAVPQTKVMAQPLQTCHRTISRQALLTSRRLADTLTLRAVQARNRR